MCSLGLSQAQHDKGGENRPQPGGSLAAAVAASAAASPGIAGPASASVSWLLLG